MKRRIAVKRLTASDLTLFKYHYKNHPAGNQKAINLNANVFVDAFYPELPTAADASDGFFSIDLNVYGPAAAPRLRLQRKIIKQSSYKNWRLDGEFIDDPLEDPERFKPLSPGDLALMEFEGTNQPDRIRLVLVAGSSHVDRDLFNALDAHLKGRRMAAIASAEIQDILQSAAIPSTHPAGLFRNDEVLEEIALGGVPDPEYSTNRTKIVSISPTEFNAAKATAERVGRLGEGLVHAHLLKRVARGEIHDVKWVADENAVSPFDLSYVIGESEVKVEVKSTNGEFGRRLHVSAGELRLMADPAETCHLYRVFELDEQTAMLRIAKHPDELAREILRAVERMPAGAFVTGFALDPARLDFREAFSLELLDDGD